MPQPGGPQRAESAQRDETEPGDLEASNKDRKTDNWNIDLPVISTFLGISATIFLGFKQFAGLQAGLDELKTEVRLIESSQSRRLESLESKIDKCFTEIQDNRRDVNSLRVETGALKNQTDVLIKRK